MGHITYGVCKTISYHTSQTLIFRIQKGRAIARAGRRAPVFREAIILFGIS